MSAFLRYIRSTIKSSKSYILNKKLLVVGIGIIGIGVGLIFAETPIKLWPEIATVFIGVTILVLGVGLVRFVIFKFWRLWPEVATVYIGIIILGLGIGLVIPDIPFFHKGEILGIASILFIFWLGIATIFVGVIIVWYAVFKGRMITIGITIAGVVTPIVGIILSEWSGGELQEKVGEIRKELQKKVGEIVSPLSSIASNTSGMDTTLKAVKEHTSDMDTTLQKVKEHTSDMDTTLSGMDTTLKDVKKHTSDIDSLVKQTSENNDQLKAIKDSLTEARKHLGKQIHQLGEDIKNYQSNIDNQTVKALNDKIAQLSENLKFQKDSLATALNSQKVSLTTTIESQKVTIDSIKDELDKAEQAQNSVRLLIGTEQKLKDERFLNTDRPFFPPWRKSYGLSKKLSSDDSLVPIKHTGEPLTLQVDGSGRLKLTLVSIEHLENPLILQVGGSGKLKLKELVYHSGKLKKDKYEKKEENEKITITFTNEFLKGMDILAVVEIDNKK